MAVHAKVLLKRMTDRFPFLRVLRFLRISFPAFDAYYSSISLQRDGRWACYRPVLCETDVTSFEIISKTRIKSQTKLQLKITVYNIMTDLAVFIVKTCLKSQNSGDLCSSGMLRSEDW